MDLSWEKLNVDKQLIKIIETEFAFKQMTPVQSATIPLFLSNKDVAVEAVTGSGKTLAFLIPILQIVIKKSAKETIGKHDVCAIIVSPTRELASQIHEVLCQLLSHELGQDLTLNSMLLIGGTNPMRDIEKFHSEGCNIIVATPGRMSDLMQRSSQLVKKVKDCLEMFILDEADQLLDMGFEKSINSILSYLPKQRRTGLFSATQTKKLEELIRAGLRNPVRIEIKEKLNRNIASQSNSSLQMQMPKTLNNSYVTFNSSQDKLPFLIEYVKSNLNAKYLIFMSTCVQVNYFDHIFRQFLPHQSFPILKIHRKLRNKRQKIFDQFKNCPSGLMLCTDVMSRGIDIPQVDWVVHFDLPNTVESYVHRCGRSGHQIGAVGNSLLMTLESENEFVLMCKEKGIDLVQSSINISVDNEMKEKIIAFMKEKARKDAHFYELGMQAFVSFIRTYSTKNAMNAILFNSINLIDVANGYGLLKMPMMPELKGKIRGGSVFNGTKEDKDIANKHRQVIYNEKEKKKKNEKCDEEVVISSTKQEQMKRRLGIKNTKLKGKKKRELINDFEMDELADDARMVKKLKKGKITNKEFDTYFGL